MLLASFTWTDENFWQLINQPREWGNSKRVYLEIRDRTYMWMDCMYKCQAYIAADSWKRHLSPFLHSRAVRNPLILAYVTIGLQKKVDFFGNIPSFLFYDLSGVLFKKKLLPSIILGDWQELNQVLFYQLSWKRNSFSKDSSATQCRNYVYGWYLRIQLGVQSWTWVKNALSAWLSFPFRLKTSDLSEILEAVSRRRWEVRKALKTIFFGLFRFPGKEWRSLFLLQNYCFNAWLEYQVLLS